MPDAVAPVDLLRPLSDALEADGYRLVIDVIGPHAIRLEVEAGHDACADCLVPRQIFADIAAKRLALDDGQTWTIDVHYPHDAPDSDRWTAAVGQTSGSPS